MIPPSSDADLGLAARHGLRNAGALMMQRGGHVLGAALFAVLVPRLLGPSDFGLYALLTSMAGWFALLSGLGAVSVMTRSVPGLRAQADSSGLRRLVSSLIALRAITGLGAALAFGLIAGLVLATGDLTSVLLITVTVWMRTVGNVTFAVFLGLDQAGRWGAGSLLRRWLTLAFVLIGVPVAGVQGACAGVLAADIVVLIAGLVQARAYTHWRDVDLTRSYLAPYLKLGAAFAVGNVLISASRQTGEALLQITTNDLAEVGYFGAASAIYLTMAHLTWQIAVASTPFLVTQLELGKEEVVARWLERLLKWMLIGLAPLVAGAWALSPTFVPWLLGEAYQPAALNLMVQATALVPFAFGAINRLAALALDKPGLSAMAAAIELAIFWAAGALLASRWGSLGLSAAVLVSCTFYALAMAWLIRQRLRYSLRRPLQVLVVALLYAPMLWVPQGLALQLTALAANTVLYLGALWGLGLVSRGEVGVVGDMLKGRGQRAEGKGRG